MADMTPTQAMAHASASQTKTDIIAAANAFVTELNDAKTASKLTDEQHAQYVADFSDYLERLASDIN